MSTSTRYHAVVKGFCGEVEADRQSFRLGQEEKEETIVANELTDREYLGMVRGEIVWNPHTDQWEKRHFDGSHPWWILVSIIRTATRTHQWLFPSNHRLPTILFHLMKRLGD
jgi:hypothetical protein